MADEQIKNKHTKEDEGLPIAMPGIRRYQFLTNLKDRMLTKNLNRTAMMMIAATLGIDVIKPLLNKVPQTIYCYECRACYATQESCPAGITFQAKLVIATRVNDYRQFIEAGGLSCLRCNQCRNYCVQHLDMAKMFGSMQHTTRQMINEGKIPKNILAKAVREGKVGYIFIVS